MKQTTSIPRKSIRYAQNFLIRSDFVASLVSLARFSNDDTVYEIGPGKGIITRQLAQVANRVIAIEIDPLLCTSLRKVLRNVENIEVVEADFLEYQIRDKDYKVFAGIPYNITAAIMRKLLCCNNTPQEAYLIMQQEAGWRFAGQPKENLFSLSVKPWFSTDIIQFVPRTEFEPIPSVDSVLLAVKKRPTPLISDKQSDLYRGFLQYGFGRWRANLKQNFKTVFTYTQWRKLGAELHFALDSKPTDLTFEQWLHLFYFLLDAAQRGHVGIPVELRDLKGRS